MKKIIFFLSIIFYAAILNGQCLNGDVEQNNFTNWQGYTGSNTNGTLDLSTFNSGIVIGRHTIVTQGNDPIVGSNLSMVRQGSYAIRLGNSATQSQADIISYTFTVTPNFSFLYALVLQDPPGNHAPNQKPFFSYWVSRSSTLVNSTQPGNLLSTPKQIFANSLNPFFSVMNYSGGLLNYKDWQTECIPELSSHIGETVTIFFATADCTESGHFGYAYIDGLCSPNLPTPSINVPSTVCSISDLITVDGSFTSNEIDSYWKINECNASGSNDIPGTDVTTPIIYNLPVGTLNVKTAYNDGGKILTAGKYYKVTLFVKNCNGVWVSAFKVLGVQFPDLRTGGNKLICCGQSATITAKIGSGINYPASSFKWYDECGNFVGNGTMQPIYNTLGQLNYINNLSVTPSKSTKYRVVFENSGCKNEQWIYVTTFLLSTFDERINDPFRFPMNNCSFPRYVSKNAPYFYLNCEGNNNVNDFSYHDNVVRSSFTYLWNTGATTNGISMQPNTNYQVSVTTPCGVITSNINLPTFTGAFPSIFFPTALTYNNWFKIFQIGLPINTRPAYNANKYLLRVYDRWGNKVCDQSVSTQIGIPNGLIWWDGRDLNGNQANLGVYNYEFTIWNCSGSKKWTGNVTLMQ